MPLRSVIRPVVLIAASPLAAGPLAAGQVTFGPAQEVAEPPPQIVGLSVLADLDGDGDVDIYQPYLLAGVHGLALNDGHGFSHGIEEIPALPLAGSVFAADVHGDGVVDLLSGDSPAITVLPGLGHGRFGGPVTTPTPLITATSAVVDLDVDGTVDLVLYRAPLFGFSGDIAVRHGHGDGSFGPEHVVDDVGNAASVGAAVGELDGDGFPDLVVLTGIFGTQTEVRCLLNRGRGDFETVATDLAFGPGTVTLADLDGDGRAELIATGSTAGGLIVLPGLGDGTFGPAITVVAASMGASAVADFDGDDAPDLAWLSNGTVTFFTQERPLAFAPAGTLAVPGRTSLDAVDLDRDGRPDLVATSQAAGFAWALNRTVR